MITILQNGCLYCQSRLFDRFSE